MVGELRRSVRARRQRARVGRTVQEGAGKDDADVGRGGDSQRHGFLPRVDSRVGAQRRSKLNLPAPFRAPLAVRVSQDRDEVGPRGSNIKLASIRVPRVRWHAGMRSSQPLTGAAFATCPLPEPAARMPNVGARARDIEHIAQHAPGEVVPVELRQGRVRLFGRRHAAKAVHFVEFRGCECAPARIAVLQLLQRGCMSACWQRDHRDNVAWQQFEDTNARRQLALAHMRRHPDARCRDGRSVCLDQVPYARHSRSARILSRAYRELQRQRCAREGLQSTGSQRRGQHAGSAAAAHQS